MSSFELLSDELLEAFRNELSDQLLYSINEAGDTEIEVDYFDFYNAVSSVFSSTTVVTGISSTFVSISFSISLIP